MKKIVLFLSLMLAVTMFTGFTGNAYAHPSTHKAVHTASKTQQKKSSKSSKKSTSKDLPYVIIGEWNFDLSKKSWLDLKF